MLVETSHDFFQGFHTFAEFFDFGFGRRPYVLQRTADDLAETCLHILHLGVDVGFEIIDDALAFLV